MRLKVKLQKIYFRLYNSVFATRPSLRLCVSVAGNYIEMMRGDMLDVGGDVVMVPNIDLETGDCLPEDVTIPSQTTLRQQQDKHEYIHISSLVWIKEYHSDKSNCFYIFINHRNECPHLRQKNVSIPLHLCAAMETIRSITE